MFCEMIMARGGKRPGAGRPPGSKNVVKQVEEAKRLAQKYSVDAFEALKKFCENVNEPSTARVAAAKELLDRGLGKAPQQVEHGGEIGVSGLLKLIDGKDRGLEPPTIDGTAKVVNGKADGAGSEKAAKASS